MTVPNLFQWADVRAIECLDDKKAIFKIEWSDNQAYVVKAEEWQTFNRKVKHAVDKQDSPRTFDRKAVKAVNAQKASAHFGYKAMAAVARGPDGRALTESEQREFLHCESCPHAGQDVKERIRQVKVEDLLMFMELVCGIRSMGGDVFGGRDAQETRLQLAALHQEDNLKHLGRIMVVDLFIGNLDRFNFKDKERVRLVSDFDMGVEKTANAIYCTQIGCLFNVGNVVFKQEENDGRTLIGFDPWDRANGAADLDLKLKKVKERTPQGTQTKAMTPHKDPDEWQGMIMKSQQDWENIAKITLNSLILGLLHNYPDIPKDAWKPTAQHYKYVLDGMEGAKNALITVYQSRSGVMPGREKAPTGVKNRMKLLGWVR